MTNKSKTCSGPECNNLTKARGLCVSHDSQIKKGYPLTPLRKVSRNRTTLCAGPDCTKFARSRTAEDGLCLTHHRQAQAGETLSSLTCAVDDCTNERRGREWCSGHYANWQKHGTPIAPPRVIQQVCEGPECETLTTVRRVYCPTHRWQINEGKPLTPIDRRSLLEKFNDSWLEDDNGCWIWQEALNTTTGYGTFYTGKDDKGHSINRAPHRWIWLQTNPDAPIPAHVCHRCDVSLCVNPKHLYGGTAADNMADRDARGRHKTNVLSYGLAQEIRAKYTCNDDIPGLAKEYGVHNVTIYNIIKGRTYRNSEGHNRRRTSVEDVLRLRELASTGDYSWDELGELFNLHPQSAYQIATRRSFKSIA